MVHWHVGRVQPLWPRSAEKPRTPLPRKGAQLVDELLPGLDDGREILALDAGPQKPTRVVSLIPVFNS